jgi:hypothetical protein
MENIMQKALALSLCGLGLLLGAAWTGYAHGQTARSARQTWEYRVDPVPGTQRSMRTSYAELDTEVMEHHRAVDEKLLNQRAAEGWELIAVGGYFYYFRRAR